MSKHKNISHNVVIFILLLMPLLASIGLFWPCFQGEKGKTMGDMLMF
jgi:hypothetical protein